MSHDARSRVVLVSGASSGIGAACARHLTDLGFIVVAGTRSTPPIDAAPGVHYVPLDVTDAASIDEAVAYARSLNEGRGLAGLVNNAGISVMGPLELLSPAALQRQFDVNVFGAVALTRACLPALRTAHGRVVFMSSIAGRTSMPYSGAYSASKFALEAFADALRQEVRRWQIGVSVVQPGAIDTPLWNKLPESWDRAAMEAPDHLGALYADAIAHMRQAIASYGARAIGTGHVARAVAHALTARRPRSRYLVGMEARLRALLQAWMPDRVHDAIVRTVMQLP